ncbi:hypothetical protein IB633_01420 [Francisella philomiragia]|uniref:Glucosyl transferase GtrII family protein n=1 Tax=Francisella philomiragia subsp. philomiragia (strain ATCC 25017 / CCUG 19701 / FSC 153 / O\|nr:DUF6056 family protein [Francisella philomiragia]AJI46960.1 putative membrane protein [Francisella philomiragia]AJI49581.1 putative membrane protein [Francisella philomiragia]MBK2019788.1 hypothetical protein [Francisella philomiragia]MBK2029758.1 hypothetical protein [Francisella philomiragia]MBK2263694.1 hypothetical protein [Francisella philomiragia]
MKKKYFIIAIISVFIVAFFLLLNYLQPMRADDFGRANTDTLAKGLIIMVHSIQADYFTWTGRVSAQALIYFLMSKTYITLSLFIVNVVNSIAFYIFMLLTFKIITYDRGRILSKDFVIYSFFFVFVFYQTGFMANILWKTGAIQYFWGLTLLTVLYYFSIVKNKNSMLLGLFIGSIIGLYNEIFVCVSILLCLAYFFERVLTKKVINDTLVAFFVACGIGGIVLITAPGNYARLDHLSSGVQSSLLQNVTRLISELIFTPQYTLMLLIMIVIFLILAFTNKNFKKLSVVVYSAALVLSLFVLVPVAKSYDLNQRVLLIYYAIFFMAAYMQIYSHSGLFVIKLYAALKKLSPIFVLLLVAQLYLIFSMSLFFYNFEQKRDVLVAQYQHSGVTDPTLPCIVDYISPTVFIDDITPNKDLYNNQAYADFYGFKSVACKTVG